MSFADRFLQEIAAAPSKRVAEAIIDMYRDELAIMESSAKALLCQVADLIAEIPGDSD